MESIIIKAAHVELYIVVTACVLAIIILSLGAAVFIIKAALNHAFPGWKDYFSRVHRTPG